ncbi:MAG: hypothetical protein AAB656_00250 [Patescibacteria group bacterium]
MAERVERIINGNLLSLVVVKNNGQQPAVVPSSQELPDASPAELKHAYEESKKLALYNARIDFHAANDWRKKP